MAHNWNLYTRWRPHERSKERPSPHPHTKYLVLILLQTRLFSRWSLPLSQLQSRLQHIYYEQPYARVDFNPQSGTLNLAWENAFHGVQAVIGRWERLCSAILYGRGKILVRSAVFVQIWKLQGIKIHRLACRFSIDFLIHTLGYGIFFGNHKDLTKVSRVLVRGFFFSRFLQSMGWYGFSYGFLVVA